MEFSGDMVSIARRGPGIAPTEPSSIVRAHACGPGQDRLHTAPDEPIVAQTCIENNRGRAAPAAVDAHRVTIYQECLPWRHMAKTIKRGRVEPAAARYQDCCPCQQRQEDTFYGFAPSGITLASKRQETPSRKPGNPDPNKREQDRNLVRKVHASSIVPVRFELLICLIPGAASLICDIFSDTPTKPSILRACDFFDFACLCTPNQMFSPHKAAMVRGCDFSIRAKVMAPDAAGRSASATALSLQPPSPICHPEPMTFIFVAGKLRIASANKHRRGPSTSRYKPFFMRQICEALRSG